MESEQVVTFVEQVVLSRPLTPIERLVLSQSWRGQTYSQIANDSAYGSDYIKEVGSKLWNDLSEALGQRVTKKNVRIVFDLYRQNQAISSNRKARRPLSNVNSESEASDRVATAEIELPGRPVPIYSPLYVERPPIEELAYAEIDKPGCVLRIKAPRKMGKSSLLNQIIARSVERGYKTVLLDFQEAEAAIFTSLDKFLRWFCANVSRQLHLAPMLEKYWDEDIGSKISCKLYFEGYLLEAIATPLVLALNEVNRIFEHPNIARDFLPMLRVWHELGRQDKTWQKLRLVVVHSTEIYVPLKLTQSPFNIGLSLQVPEFNLEQVQKLAKLYRFAWAAGEMGMKRLAPLVEMLGGHPYLISLAFYHISQGNMTLEEVLQEAPQVTGIYSTHLQSLLVTLLEEPQLAAAFTEAIAASESVTLDALVAHKLESMGLIQLEGNRAKPRCQLYRLYFRDRLENPFKIDRGLKNLELENLNLHRLSNLDELTQLSNRCYFNQYLQTLWLEQAGKDYSVSVILCDLDYFKFYTNARGQLAGDECLQRIANVIRECVKNKVNVVARYGGEEFAALLLQTNAETAVKIAEEIRAGVKALAIAHDPKLDGLPARVLTVSLGVASAMPSVEISSQQFLAAADKALHQSKRQGRDRVTLAQSIGVLKNSNT